MFQKYEAEQGLWVEAYKYIRPTESPDYVVIHDLLLDIYEKVDFYTKDPNKDPELGKSIIIKLVIATATRPELRELIKQVDLKKKELIHKN